jgi:phage terminase large subunit-like protein
MLKVIIIGALFLSCKVSINTDEKELLLLNATRQKLYAGAKGGGVITEYNIMVSVTTNQPLQIDSVWVDGRKFLVRVLDEKTHNPAKNFQAGDTLSVIFSAHTPDAAIQTDTPEESNPPIDYHGAALLRYYQGNTPQYLVIPTFTKLEPVYAP